MNIRRIMCLVAMLMVIPFSFADAITVQAFYDYDAGLYGLEGENGAVVMTPTYDYIGAFHEGYATVTLGDYDGVINDKGQEIVKPMYDFVSQYQDGLAIVYKDDAAGAIDTTGKVVVPSEYTDMSLFVNGNALAVQNDKIGLVSKANEVVHPFEWDDINMYDFEEGYETFVFVSNGMYGVVNFDGQVLYGPVDQRLLHIADDRVVFENGDQLGVTDFDGKVLVPAVYMSVYISGNGYIAEADEGYVFLNAAGVKVSDYFYSVHEESNELRVISTDEGYGVYNSNTQKMVLPAIYNDITVLKNEEGKAQYFEIELDDEDSWSYKVGLATLDGKILLEPRFYGMTFINEDLISYYNEDYLYGFYTLSTKEDTGTVYNDFRNNDDGYLLVGTQDDTYGLLNTKGDVVVKAEADYIYDQGQFYLIEKDDKYATFNKATRRMSSYKYDHFYDFQTIGKTKAAIISVNNKYGILKEDGSYLVAPYYDDIDSFSDGYAVVTKNDLSGFVDENGKVIVEPTYSWIDNFENGLAIVQLDGQYGYIRTNGTIAIPLKFEDATEFSELGYAAVQVGGKIGLVDKTGRYTVRPVYDDMEPIDLETVLVYDAELDKYGIVKTSGEVIAKPIYDELGYFGDTGVTYVRMNTKYALINDEGQVLTQFKFDMIDSFYDGLADIKIGGAYGVMNMRGEYILK